VRGAETHLLRKANKSFRPSVKYILSSSVRVRVDTNDKVTRLGDFSPLGKIVYFGQFFKIQKPFSVATFFHGKSYVNTY
jgi:hypothetical protein